jgi:hypothetical protein
VTDRRRWALVSLLAAAVVTVARLRTSRGRDEYAIWPDEPAQLAIARWIGGGTRWNMDDHSVWRPLFGTLLAPAYWFTDDPVTVFHTALVLNALLGGLAAALLVFVARRLTLMSPWWCAVAAVIVSLAPAALFTTDFVFAESLVGPLYLATLLTLFRLYDTPTLRDGVLAGMLSALAFGTHSRMLPLALITLGLVALLAVRRRLAIRDAVLSVAVAVLALYAVSRYTSYVVDRLWDEPSTRNSLSGVLDQLTNGVAVFVSLLGQTWYLLATTLGVVAYGAVALARSVGGARSASVPARGDARVVLVVVGASVALSVVFMSDRWRSDQLVYGRYNDAIVTPVLVVGLAALFAAIPYRRLLATTIVTASVTLATGGLLWALRADVLSQTNGLEPMILGLQPFATSDTTIDVVRISVWAAALTLALGGLALAARRSGAPLIVAGALGVSVMVGGTRTSSIVDRYWDDSGDASAVAELRDGVLADGVPVDFFLQPGSTSTNRMMLYQFYLPRTEFTVVNDLDADATSPYVFARLREDGLAESGATLIWRDPQGRYGLWER